jgi:hypothetical protein
LPYNTEASSLRRRHGLDRGRGSCSPPRPPTVPGRALRGAMLIDAPAAQRCQDQVGVSSAAEAAPMATAGRTSGALVECWPARHRVPRARIASVEPGRLRFASARRQRSTCSPTCPSVSAEGRRHAGLTNVGWVPSIARRWRRPRRGIGRSATYGDPLSIGRPLPKARHVRPRPGEVVAATSRAITGRGEPRTFDGTAAASSGGRRSGPPRGQ